MGLDSVEFVMEIENAFSIKIPDADAERMRTIADVATCIHRHLQDAGRGTEFSEAAVLEEVRGIAARIGGVPIEQVRPDSHFLKDLGFD